MATTRNRALDAAIELLGTGGLRALTHARVDERAGLPKGSTSNYFRTRATLLAGTVDRILERELAEIGEPFSPTSAAELVDALCGFVVYGTSVNRILTTARMVLFMEGSHNTEIRDAVSRGRAVMESWAVAVLTGLGAPDPTTAATALAACSEGLILHRIARHDETDPRPAIELVVRAALARP
ncbi:TetR/AcrR family transcriptional regulator [Longispora urticae]